MKSIKKTNDVGVAQATTPDTPKCVQDISIPSRKEMVEIMQKRGYTLAFESPNKLTMDFVLLKGNDTAHSWKVTIWADRNMFMFATAINPGVVKMSTDFFTGVDDDKLFGEIEQYVKDVLAKIYK